MRSEAFSATMPPKEAKMAHAPLFLILAFASACTLTRGQVDTCESTAECQAAFGVGSICSSDGFCEAPTEFARCETVFPTDLESNPDAYPDIVLIGTIVDQSLETQRARAQSVELAVRDANEAGGVEGRLFGLIVCTNEESPDFDARSQLEASVASADYLASVGAVAVVGPQSSAAAEAVFTQSSDQLLLISPAASGDALTDLEPAPSDAAPGRLWRTTAPDARQAAAIATDIASSERNIMNLAIVHSSDNYGRGLSSQVQENLPSSITVVDYEYETLGRLSEIQAEIGRSEAEEILLISSRTDELVGFLRPAAENMRYDERTFFLTDAAANRDLAEGIDDLTDLLPRIRGTRPAISDAVTLDSFYSRYSITFMEDARDLSFTPNAYDAGWMALYAVAWAVLQESGELNPTTLGRGLRQLSSGDTIRVQLSSWSDVNDAFAMGMSIDLQGASGDLDYDPSTEELSAEFRFWQVTSDGITDL